MPEGTRYRPWNAVGKSWAGRFKSVILGDKRAVVDCLLYIELNAVRAGLVERPEDWRPSSLNLREIGEDGWLMPLTRVIAQETEADALVEYRSLIYHRGAVPTKAGQVALSEDLLRQEVERGFEVSGVFRKRLKYFVEGLVIGSEGLILEYLARLRDSGTYKRRSKAISHLDGLHLSLREQRRHASTS